MSDKSFKTQFKPIFGLKNVSAVSRFLLKECKFKMILN